MSRKEYSTIIQHFFEISAMELVIDVLPNYTEWCLGIKRSHVVDVIV